MMQSTITRVLSQSEQKSEKDIIISLIKEKEELLKQFLTALNENNTSVAIAVDMQYRSISNKIAAIHPTWYM